MKHFFDGLELFMFVLPALPNDIRQRLFILFVYFMMHHFKVQHSYARFKRHCLDEA
jgi:hypothetical protein